MIISLLRCIKSWLRFDFSFQLFSIGQFNLFSVIGAIEKHQLQLCVVFICKIIMFIIIPNSNNALMLDDLCDVTLSIDFPSSTPIPFKLKCYNCSPNASPLIPLSCIDCGGKGWVSSECPMAILLGDIIDRKMRGSNQRKEREKEKETGQCEVIKEEEEQMIKCELCFREVCKCGWQNQIKQMNHKTAQQEDNDRKLCSSCTRQLQECFSVCLTCQSSQIPYFLCHICTDHSSDVHPQSHNFDLSLSVNIRNRSNHHKLVDRFYDQSSEYKLEELRLEVERVMLIKRNSSITEELEEESPGVNNSIMEKSLVKLETDGLFSSYEINKEQWLSHQQIRNLDKVAFFNEQCQSPTFSLSSNCQKINEKKSVVQSIPDYLFMEYRCDLCDQYPIRNVRYHCQECEDYDLCAQCWQHKKDNHGKHQWQRIQGGKKSMLCKKDMNRAAKIPITPQQKLAGKRLSRKLTLGDEYKHKNFE